MMAKRGTSALNYTPERGRYSTKPDTVILGKVRTAEKALGLGRAVAEVGNQAQTSQQPTQDTIEHMLKLVRGQHDLGISAEKRYVGFDAKSAKPADVIFRVMGMLYAPPKYQFVAPLGSKMTDDDKMAIEEHINALDQWTFRKYGIRWDLQDLFWVLVGGTGYIQQSYLPFHWDKNVLKRKDGEEDGRYNERVDGYRAHMGPPIFIEALDPRMVYPLPTAMGTKEWVKIYKVQRYELDEALAKVGIGVKLNAQGGVDEVLALTKKAGLELPLTTDDSLTDSLTYYEYIDDTMIYYVVGDRVVYSYAHNGGIKIFEAKCLQTGLKERHMAAVGILWAVRNEIPQYDFLRTLWANKAYLDVFPPLFAILGDKDDPIRDEAGKPTEWELEPGTVKQIRGQLVNALKDGQSGMDFRAMIEMMAGDIDLATIPGLARGIAGAQQPGYSINQLAQSMRTLWRPAIEAIELQRSMMKEHYLWMVKNLIKKDCSIYAMVDSQQEGRLAGEYVTLEPDVIPDYFQVQALLEPELPIDKQGNMLTWMKAGMEGWATFEEVTREGFGKTNPIARERQIMKDQAKRAFVPKALEDAMALGRVKLTNKILEEQGLDKLNSAFSMDVQAIKAARAQQTVTDGGGGAPPASNVQPPAGPPGAAGGGPQVVGSTAGQTGSGIAPTAGANPNDPAPAFRGGS